MLPSRSLLLNSVLVYDFLECLKTEEYNSICSIIMHTYACMVYLASVVVIAIHDCDSVSLPVVFGQTSILRW